MSWHDVIVRRKEAGQYKSEMFVNSSKSDLFANQLSQIGNEQQWVEVISLDEDITERCTPSWQSAPIAAMKISERSLL